MRTESSASHKLCTAASRDGGSLSSSHLLGMFIGFSSTAPAISKDPCKCLKGSDLKRELSLLGSAGIRGWVWLACRPCVDFRDENKKRKKASYPSAHWTAPILGDTHVLCPGASLAVLEAVPGRCGGELLPSLSLPFLAIPVSILEQCPDHPWTLGQLLRPLDPGNFGGEMRGNCLGTPRCTWCLWELFPDDESGHRATRNSQEGWISMGMTLFPCQRFSLSCVLSNEIAHSALGL